MLVCIANGGIVVKILRGIITWISTWEPIGRHMSSEWSAAHALFDLKYLLTLPINRVRAVNDNSQLTIHLFPLRFRPMTSSSIWSFCGFNQYLDALLIKILWRLWTGVCCENWWDARGGNEVIPPTNCHKTEIYTISYEYWKVWYFFLGFKLNPTLFQSGGHI